MHGFQLPPIYPITLADRGQGLSHIDLVSKFLKGGASLIQVREKSYDDGELYQSLIVIQRLCQEAGARLIVNDRVDLALAVNAAGVHLGQSDLPVSVARELLGRESLIGLSTHTEKQFEAAQDFHRNHRNH